MSSPSERVRGQVQIAVAQMAKTQRALPGPALRQRQHALLGRFADLVDRQADIEVDRHELRGKFRRRFANAP